MEPVIQAKNSWPVHNLFFRGNRFLKLPFQLFDDGVPARGDSHITLKFYCDWVAHPVLKGPEAQNIVRQFDKYQELTEAMKNAAHGQQLTVDVSQGLQYG